MKPTTLRINGISVTPEMLMALFLMVFNPDPTAWIRFETRGSDILVEVSHEAKAEPTRITLQ